MLRLDTLPLDAPAKAPDMLFLPPAEEPYPLLVDGIPLNALPLDAPAEDPDALAARLAAQLAPEVAPTRSMAAVVVASPCSVATVTQHLVDELQLDAAVGFGSHREAFCEACDGVYQCMNHFSRSFSANG